MFTPTLPPGCLRCSGPLGPIPPGFNVEPGDHFVCTRCMCLYVFDSMLVAYHPTGNELQEVMSKPHVMMTLNNIMARNGRLWSPFP